ncbi:stage V sporulation protein AA [Anaerocolumna sp. MB42-C2]|uniref:stage V sporulation protein AA n=1 Tax=Anaerocolumna sp. MB42-C2 TaxID=3070997 RepID=UPI0027DF15AC|nr:stage V sporulation protein AA [Anaerocolumna sp. MB42-C2]WMJ86332.1 stage V sporulation protein AA [Anaerocolumna sp. MB42-C2]
MNDGCLYIKIDKNTMVTNKTIYLKDIAKLYSYDIKMVNDLKSQVVFETQATKKTNYIFSVLKLIELINKIYPEVQIINLGESDFIVHYDPPKKFPKIFEYIKVSLVSLMVFFGAAFTIMTFNEDANVKEIFKTIYKLVTGNETGGKILEVSYAVGLPLGIIVFFNHFSKFKLGNDPTPMQVQMRLYEENLDTTLIENANREDKTIDVL